MQLRIGIILVALLGLASFLGYQIELTLPTHPPDAKVTYTPMTRSTDFEIGSYDVLGRVISRAEVEALRQTENGQVQLASESGAVEVTDDLIDLGKDAFYRETFGNEYFFTDVGVIEAKLS